MSSDSVFAGEQRVRVNLFDVDPSAVTIDNAWALRIGRTVTLFPQASTAGRGEPHPERVAEFADALAKALTRAAAEWRDRSEA